ncbi:hypothetical protein [Salinibacterium xinjiangense]|nr:hypothetical protein [Salinibacterium xinjiangense]
MPQLTDLRSAAASRAMAIIDRAAASLVGVGDESQTLLQLLVDVADDLLAGVLGRAAPHLGMTIGVLVLVMTLLGSKQPGSPRTMN